jgi:hypothetical protein
MMVVVLNSCLMATSEASVGGSVELGEGQVTVLTLDLLGLGLNGVVGARAGAGAAGDGEVNVNAGVDAVPSAVPGDALAAVDDQETKHALAHDICHSVNDDLLVDSGDEAALRDTDGDEVEDHEEDEEVGSDGEELADLRVDLEGRAPPGEEEGNDDGDAAESSKGEKRPGGLESLISCSAVHTGQRNASGKKGPDEGDPMSTGEEGENGEGDEDVEGPLGVTDPKEFTLVVVGVTTGVAEGHDEVSQGAGEGAEGDQEVGQTGLRLHIPDVGEEEEDNAEKQQEAETDPQGGGSIARQLRGRVVGGSADNAGHFAKLDLGGKVLQQQGTTRKNRKQ